MSLLLAITEVSVLQYSLQAETKQLSCSSAETVTKAGRAGIVGTQTSAASLSATFTKQSKLATGTLACSATSNPVQLATKRAFKLDAQVCVVGGSDASIAPSRKLQTACQVYASVGQLAGFRFNKVVSIALGDVQLATPNTAFKASFKYYAVSLPVVITQNSSPLTRQLKVTAAVKSVTSTPVSVGFTRDSRLSGTVLQVLQTSGSVALEADRRMPALTASATSDGKATLLSKSGVVFAASTVNVEAAPYPSSFYTTRISSPAANNVLITSYASLLKKGYALPLTVNNISTQMFSAVVSKGKVLQVSGCPTSVAFNDSKLVRSRVNAVAVKALSVSGTATLLKSKVIAATTHNVGITASSFSFKLNKSFVVSPNQTTLLRLPASFKRSYVCTVPATSYSPSFKTSGLKATRYVGVTKNGVTTVLNAASLVKSDPRTIAGLANVSVASRDITVKCGRNISSTTHQYAFTAKSATLKRGYKLAAQKCVTYADATASQLKATRQIPANIKSMSAVGTGAIKVDRKFSAQVTHSSTVANDPVFTLRRVAVAESKAVKTVTADTVLLKLFRYDVEPTRITQVCGEDREVKIKYILRIVDIDVNDRTAQVTAEVRSVGVDAENRDIYVKREKRIAE